MRIILVSPVAPDSPHGNGVTARRWAAILRGLGHEVTLGQAYDGGAYDLLIALHARKSAAAVTAFHAAFPDAPIVVALTGTDLYPDLDSAGVDAAVLACARRLVVLQPLGVAQLPAALRDRTHVILQSMPPITPRPPRPDRFDVVLLAHLRPVKDPLRIAAAVRRLPVASRVRVTHVGEGRDAGVVENAAAESADNPRYTWLGPRSRDESLGLLAGSRLLALTSLNEGGANAISEALAAGVPIVSSRIPGSVGLLGDDYPGYFPPGDTDALATLLDAVESDRNGLYERLRDRCAALAALVDPARERAAWERLLAELEVRAPM